MTLPSRLGSYVPLFHLGRGGMGEVLAARQDGWLESELVAIKRILPVRVQRGDAVRALLDEARATSCVTSPYVVRVREVGADEDGRPFLVMDLVVGTDLAELITSASPLPAPAVLTWLAQIAEGLAAVHAATRADGSPLGLVHRDVSPHNILLGTEGVARLTDFGIALFDERLQASTETGWLKGKLPYMSPEQTRAEAVTASSDVFSLGATAWEALIGRPLFMATAPSEILARVRELEIEPPHVLRPDVSLLASSAIMRALSRAPAERPSAAELARLLRASVREPPSPAELASIVAPVAMTRIRHLHSALSETWPALAPKMSAPETQLRLRASNPKTLALCALALVLALGSALYLVLR